MIREYVVRSAVLLTLAGAAFAACGEATPSTPQTKYCSQLCDCNKCTESERASCLDDAVNLEDKAKSKNCRDDYDAYATCITTDASCSDGSYDESLCFNEETSLNTCLNPPPPCASTNDGICDEPAPAGSGKCAKGADTVDCAPKPCPTVNNGVCDEPKGTNTCELGSDPVDCGPEPCPYVENGTCDEPGGTGICDEGTDALDCYCPSTADGICDEPQGTGYCSSGTDTVDCAPCVTCYAAMNDPQNAKPCPASKPLFDAFNACACFGTCASYCANNICVALVGTQQCADCLFASCNDALSDCVADM